MLKRYYFSFLALFRYGLKRMSKIWSYFSTGIMLTLAFLNSSIELSKSSRFSFGIKKVLIPCLTPPRIFSSTEPILPTWSPWRFNVPVKATLEETGILKMLLNNEVVAVIVPLSPLLAEEKLPKFKWIVLEAKSKLILYFLINI